VLIRLYLLLSLMGLPAWAAPCDSLYAGLSDSLVMDVSATVGDIDSLLKKIKAQAGFEDKNSESLLRMALENAIQHGVEDMYLPTAAPLRLSVAKSAGEVEIRITNRTYKKFPARLERVFEPGESLALSSDERPFPRGFGLGLSQMFRYFSAMPKGSEMGWSTAGETATFRLKVKNRSL
jgi:hypothetical protein